MTTRYVIASLNHTTADHEHITFWAKDQCGYVLAFDDRLGLYLGDEAVRLHATSSCLAVPEASVRALLTPTPYFKNSRGQFIQFYDVAGPVVNNTAENWAHLRAAAMPHVWRTKEKPGVFRRKRRSLSLPGAIV